MTLDKERLEQKLGEAIGLEMAAQKAVEELSSKGLLPDEPPTKKKLEGMREEANNHQTQMENLVTKLSQSDGIDSSKIQETAHETEQKATKIMETYLGENPDSQEAIEFLCLADSQLAIVADCKHWKRNDLSSLSSCAKRQAEKACKLLAHRRKISYAIHIILTLHAINIRFVDGIPLVPVFKFDSFVEELPLHLSEMKVISRNQTRASC
ncbi:MAG: hypothetical protein WCC17_24740 [Candidatus Nitrosopolaris sp.]